MRERAPEPECPPVPTHTHTVEDLTGKEITKEHSVFSLVEMATSCLCDFVGQQHSWVTVRQFRPKSFWFLLFKTNFTFSVNSVFHCCFSSGFGDFGCCHFQVWLSLVPLCLFQFKFFQLNVWKYQWRSVCREMCWHRSVRRHSRCRRAKSRWTVSEGVFQPFYFQKVQGYKTATSYLCISVAQFERVWNWSVIKLFPLQLTVLHHHWALYTHSTKSFSLCCLGSKGGAGLFKWFLRSFLSTRNCHRMFLNVKCHV